MDINIKMLLNSQRKKVGSKIKIKFGENWLDLNKDFKFYCTTKLNDPHFSP